MHLPVASNENFVENGSVIGWGVCESCDKNQYSTRPYKQEAPAVKASSCYPTVPELVEYSSHRTFCGSFVNQSKTSCIGDGGFYITKTSKWEVQGILSGPLRHEEQEEHACGTKKYSLYTNVAWFVDWVEKVMAETKVEKTVTCRLSPNQ